MNRAMPIDEVSIALATGATALLWWWSTLGRRGGGGAAVQHLLRGRFIAASAALLPLTLLAAASASLARLTHPAAVGVLAAAAFCVREALDPLLPGFWHHKRLRPLGLVGAVACGALLGLVVPRPELAPLIGAVLVFHRHAIGAKDLFSQSLSEIDALSRKVQALDATLRLERALLVEATALEEPSETASRSR